MQRNISLDVLKIILALMVVGLHGKFLLDINRTYSYMFVNGIFRIAVPIFFIINGFFLFNTFKNFQFKKWLKRVTILYFVWMLVYFDYWFKLETFSRKEFIDLAVNIIMGYYHLWYLNAMIGSGILLFLLKDLPNKKLAQISLSLFLIGLLIQYSGNYHVFSNPQIDELINCTEVYRNFLFFGFPFCSIGFLINRNNLQTSIYKKLLFISLALGTIFLIIESLFNYSHLPKIGGFDMYLSLLLICPVIFFIACRSGIKSNRNSKNIALYSTAIYLSHPFLMDLLHKHTPFLPTEITILTCLSSVITGYILIKIHSRYNFIL